MRKCCPSRFFGRIRWRAARARTALGVRASDALPVDADSCGALSERGQAGERVIREVDDPRERSRDTRLDYHSHRLAVVPVADQDRGPRGYALAPPRSSLTAIPGREAAYGSNSLTRSGSWSLRTRRRHVHGDVRSSHGSSPQKRVTEADGIDLGVGGGIRRCEPREPRAHHLPKDRSLHG